MREVEDTPGTCGQNKKKKKAKYRYLGVLLLPIASCPQISSDECNNMMVIIAHTVNTCHDKCHITTSSESRL
jgi:hypothetical protein